jgi:hypothetical protein
MMNPYQSPSQFDDSRSNTASISPGRRPGGLTAICVIAMILGGLGAVFSLFGLGSLAFRSQLENAFAPQRQPGMSKEFVEAQRDMQQKTNAVQQRFLGLNSVLGLVNLVLGTSMFIGGIYVLQLSPKGREFLAAVFVAAIVFELVRIPIIVSMQYQVAAVMSDSMPRMMNSINNQDGSNAAAEAATIFTRIWIFVLIAIMAAFFLAKIIFYTIGVRYLGRPQIRRLFPSVGYQN